MARFLLTAFTTQCSQRRYNLCKITHYNKLNLAVLNNRPVQNSTVPFCSRTDRAGAGSVPKALCANFRFFPRGGLGKYFRVFSKSGMRENREGTPDAGLSPRPVGILISAPVIQGVPGAIIVTVGSEKGN
jgi:hypothetical protein